MTVVYIFLAIILLYYLQKTVYRYFWDKALSIDMRFSKSEAFEGEYVILQEQVSNGKPLPLPYVDIGYSLSHKLMRLSLKNAENIGDDRHSIFISPTNKTVTKKTKLLCSKRGYYKIENAIVSSNDIILTEEKQKSVHVSLTLTVYPKLIKVDEQTIPYKKMIGNILAKRFLIPDPFEFGGIREYQPYDSFNQINFKSWAKTGELQSNIYAHTVSQHVKIVLNTQGCNIMLESIYENALRLTAFFARNFIELGIPVGLVTTGADTVTGKPGITGYGLSSWHLHEIYGTLARLDLYKTVVNAQDIMEDNFSEDDTIILISTYVDDNLCQWFNNIAIDSRLWIIPKPFNYELPVPPYENITMWEVNDE